MAKYIARIELHDAEKNGDEYEKLHTEMDAKGYNRTVSVNGVDSHLPNATYINRTEKTSVDIVIQEAKQAADATGKKSSIVAFKIESVADIRASELEPVKKK